MVAARWAGRLAVAAAADVLLLGLGLDRTGLWTVDLESGQKLEIPICYQYPTFLIKQLPYGTGLRPEVVFTYVTLLMTRRNRAHSGRPATRRAPRRDTAAHLQH